MKETKNGRGRHYDFKPYPGVADVNIGFTIGILNELAERVYDQISDLPVEALEFVPEGSYLAIGKLVMHIAGGEARAMELISGKPIPAVLEKDLKQTGRDDLGTPPAQSKSASELIELCRRVREEVTIPTLQELDDLDRPIKNNRNQGPATAKELIMHQIWHWIFHSGHIGLTRLLWGSEYDWTMA